MTQREEFKLLQAEYESAAEGLQEQAAYMLELSSRLLDLSIDIKNNSQPARLEAASE